MHHRDTILRDCRRGLAALNAARKSGVKFSGRLSEVERDLRRLSSEAGRGEALGQVEAAEAASLADSVRVHLAASGNGRLFAFFESVSRLVGSLAAVKLAIGGAAVAMLLFAIRRHADLGSQLLNQVVPAVVGMLLLIFFSLACAGVIVARRKPGLIRNSVACMFALMPLVAALLMWERANDADSIARQIVVEARLLVPFFLSGLLLLLAQLVFPVKTGKRKAAHGDDDDFFSDSRTSSLLSDPNYSSDLGYVSDATEI